VFIEAALIIIVTINWILTKRHSSFSSHNVFSFEQLATNSQAELLVNNERERPRELGRCDVYYNNKKLAAINYIGVCYTVLYKGI
jgi:hypothetical protein